MRGGLKSVLPGKDVYEGPPKFNKLQRDSNEWKYLRSQCMTRGDGQPGRWTDWRRVAIKAN